MMFENWIQENLDRGPNKNHYVMTIAKNLSNANIYAFADALYALIVIIRAVAPLL